MRIRPFVGLLFLFSLSASWMVIPAAAAQTAAAVEFIDVSAEAHFPEGIDFRLEVRSDVDVEHVQLFWRAAGANALTLAEPDFHHGETLVAIYQAETSIRYLPPGLDVEYFWRVTDGQGSVHESPTSSFLYIDERFEWQSIDGGLLSVWWYSGSEEYATEILNTANRTLIELNEVYGLQAEQPIRIIVYGDGRDFSSAMPPNSADWIGGVAYSALNHIIAQIAPGTSAQRESSRMIPHEVSHVVVHQASLNPYNSPPPWLDEGLATFVQETGDGRLNPVLDRAVRDGRLIPLNALKSSFPLDPDQAMLSYAESLSVVAYLVETHGSATVGDLVSVYRTEVSHDQAVESVLGFSIEELDTRWKESLGYQGDRPVDAGNTGASTRSVAVVGTMIALALCVAAGVVIVSLWRTRAYRASDGDNTGMSGLEDEVNDGQP